MCYSKQTVKKRSESHISYRERWSSIQRHSFTFDVRDEDGEERVFPTPTKSTLKIGYKLHRNQQIYLTSITASSTASSSSASNASVFNNTNYSSSNRRCYSLFPQLVSTFNPFFGFDFWLLSISLVFGISDESSFYTNYRKKTTKRSVCRSDWTLAH
jgi:hypothetical protein